MLVVSGRNEGERLRNARVCKESGEGKKEERKD
jgi:hypothetical protein